MREHSLTIASGASVPRMGHWLRRRGIRQSNDEALVDNVNADRDLSISTTSKGEQLFARICIISVRSTTAMVQERFG